MGEKVKTYSANRRCSNCMTLEVYKIPYGTTIKDYFKKNKVLCKNCGCPLYG